MRFAFAPDWSAGLGVYNILNRHANAAEFWYVDRLPGDGRRQQAGAGFTSKMA